MATLKFRHAHGFGWVTDVRSVETGVAWEVPERKWGRPGSCQPSSSFGSGLNVIDHGLPFDDQMLDSSPGTDGTESDGREEDVPQRMKMAVELAVTHHGARNANQALYEIHIVPAGECWLMGDDGRTIDRIP